LNRFRRAATVECDAKYSQQAQQEDARVYAESTKVMEETIADALSEKARDPRWPR
jgi:hypothetical protein